MTYKLILIFHLIVFSILFCGNSAFAKFAVHSQTAIEIELTGFNSLETNSIYKGTLDANTKYEIDTPYRGLVLLTFSGGQSYPVIIGEQYFSLNISSPGKLPSFSKSPENDIFYKALKDGEQVPSEYAFANLMIQAKHLLDSSYSIRTRKELTVKKKEFHEFVNKHYENLSHSDMLKRLIAQYFMFHEYIDYHSKGAPATDIMVKYRKEVVSGVRSWIKILQPHLPEHEILNYCVSLYYKRSMVALASLIIDNFRDAAFCPGDNRKIFSFPKDLLISKTDSMQKIKLGDLKGRKIISFVSEDCPVSMIKTVIKTRQLANQKENLPVIIAPLDTSRSYLNMARMISKANMFFISDKKWRKENLAKKIKLPLFVVVDDNK
jgi:hypothetical protein